MAILDKLTRATQDVVRGTKDLTDVARLNSLISEEQKQIANLYSQIGKVYCESHEADQVTPLGKMCFAVAAAKERIAKHNEEILKIKGTKRCPTCGTEVSLISAFCGECGSKIELTAEEPQAAEASKRFCSNCGSEMSEGVAFCTSCGQKQE